MKETISFQDKLTHEILDTLRGSGYPIQGWGCAVDQTPLFSVRVGGEKKPTVLITAGVHAHECAGVFSALELIPQLETDYETHIFPMRDPFGFSGVNYCLSYASNQLVDFSDHSEALTFLKETGELLLSESDLELFCLGDVGFIWTHLQPGLKGFEQVNSKMKGLLQKYTERLMLLWGKPVMLLNPATDFAGSGEMQRCWHGFIDENGRWLNLNRSFGVENPPPEVSALEQMIVSLKPGLIIEMQEDDVPGFWVAAPRQQDNSTVVEIGKVILEAVSVEGCSICSIEQMTEQKHRDLEISGFLIPERDLNGYFWMNQDLLKEGPNLLSYAAEYCLSIGIESPLGYSLDKRVNGLVKGVQEAIRLWSKIDHSNIKEVK